MTFDVAVIGGGAAGSMAAIRASRCGKKTVLIERNDSIGKKILMTGKGRCNLTNRGSLDDLLASFGREGRFFRTAFTRFGNEDLISFFTDRGLQLKTERQNRVFPADDKARSVVSFLERSLQEAGVTMRCGTRIRRIRKDGGGFVLETDEGKEMAARKVIMTTGGASYTATGSSGDGFVIARELGHAVRPLTPGLVPLCTKETWVQDVQGLALKNIRITCRSGRKRVDSGIGELLFTHFGVSGPLILDLSAAILALPHATDGISLAIDLKPGMTGDDVDGRLLADITKQGSKDLRNFLRLYMPVSLCDVFVRLAAISPAKKVSQLASDERRRVRDLMKALPLTITGSLSLDQAMVTTGGIPHAEIDPRTMASRLVPGLYFAGEIIAGAASSGGYNLQQAFSTGYLAGEEAARDA